MGLRRITAALVPNLLLNTMLILKFTQNLKCSQVSNILDHLITQYHYITSAHYA